MNRIKNVLCLGVICTTSMCMQSMMVDIRHPLGVFASLQEQYCTHLDALLWRVLERDFASHRGIDMCSHLMDTRAYEARLLCCEIVHDWMSPSLRLKWYRGDDLCMTEKINLNLANAKRALEGAQGFKDQTYVPAYIPPDSKEDLDRLHEAIENLRKLQSLYLQYNKQIQVHGGDVNLIRALRDDAQEGIGLLLLLIQARYESNVNTDVLASRGLQIKGARITQLSLELRAARGLTEGQSRDDIASKGQEIKALGCEFSNLQKIKEKHRAVWVGINEMMRDVDPQLITETLHRYNSASTT